MNNYEIDTILTAVENLEALLASMVDSETISQANAIALAHELDRIQQVCMID
jgi:hypothetical protein